MMSWTIETGGNISRWEVLDSQGSFRESGLNRVSFLRYLSRNRMSSHEFNQLKSFTVLDCVLRSSFWTASTRQKLNFWGMQADTIWMWICSMFMRTRILSTGSTSSTWSTIPAVKVGWERSFWNKTILSKASHRFWSEGLYCRHLNDTYFFTSGKCMSNFCPVWLFSCNHWWY